MSRLIAAASVILPILSFILGIQEAAAQDSGQKFLLNYTGKRVELEIAAIYKWGEIPFAGDSDKSYVPLFPNETRWFSYYGVGLRSVKVSGEVGCELRSNQRGDAADTQLNGYMGLAIVAQGATCTIKGMNPGQ